MSEPNKYREWILETIDSLRSRKARPDLERICRMVRRRHGSDPERTRAELDKLIQEQTVLKVSYKGSTSYRNAARVQRKSRNRSESADAPAERGSGGDTDREGGGRGRDPEPGREPRAQPPAAGERLQPAPGRGAATQGEKASAARDEGLGRLVGEQGGGWGGHPSPASTRSAGARGGSEAAETGADTRSQTSSPLPPPSSSSSSPRRRHRQTQTAPLKPELRPSGGGPGSDPGPGPSAHRGRVRAGAERGGLRAPPRGNPSSERPTKGFALQDRPSGGEKPPSPALPENEPMDKADEGEGQEPNEGGEEEEDDDGPGCDEGGGASLEATTTRSGSIENIAAEAGIQKASGLEAPLDGKQGSAVTAAGSSGMSGLGVFLVLQAPPARGPPLPQCNGAPMEERATASDPLHTEAQSPGERDDINPTPSMGYNSVESKTEVGAPSCMLTPTASPGDSYLSEDRGSNNSSGGLMKCEGVKGSPVDWTVSDVVNYFTEAGFPEQAAAFRIQEIDGKSLLLMQRNDVLTGLSIRLGPALKIYERHVKVLQKTHFEDDDC